jgi:hypothetical protein
MEKEIKEFKDLKFGKHPNGFKGAKQAKHKLANGIILSVVGGGVGLYGNGKTTFEVAAWYKDSNEWIKLGENDSVLGWLSKEEVTGVIQRLLALDFKLI